MLLAATWTGLEVARAHWLTQDPWLLIGYALLPYEHLIQIADVAGVYGLSFLVVFVNAAIAEVVAEAVAHARSPAVPGTSPLRQPDRSRSDARGRVDLR